MKPINNISLIIKLLKSKNKKCTKYNTISLNVETNKIEMNGEKMLDYVYAEILELCKQKYPDIKFTKNDIKNSVEKMAIENKYMPDKKIKDIKSDWYSKLEFDKDDKPLKTLNNVIKFFESYPLYKDKFYYNEFTSYEEYNNDLIRDYHISQFRSVCEKELGFESRDKVECAIQYVTHQNSSNPYIDAIDNLLWDGEKRAESFFIDFIGVHDTKLNRSMTMKWFYAMMKRLYEPGCPFDNMLIIYDPKQGTGKSKLPERLIYSLGINYGYNTSISCDNKDKDNVDKLNKTWIVGIDEMNEFLKKNPEQTKQFLAQNSDQARLSYAKRSEIYKRHCVFYGNSNLEIFLKDYTDTFERRYWVMEADGEVHNNTWWNEHLTDEYCRQVLAEIKYFYDNNPNYNYTTLDAHERKELEEVQYRHKSLNNDVLLKHRILKILQFKYSKNTFYDYEEFKNTIENEYFSIHFPSKAAVKQDENTAEIHKNDDIFTQNSMVFYKEIEYIPTDWLKMIIEEKFGRNISTQYITSLLRDNYAKIKYRYKGINNGKPIYCYAKI